MICCLSICCSNCIRHTSQHTPAAFLKPWCMSKVNWRREDVIAKSFRWRTRSGVCHVSRIAMPSSATSMKAKCCSLEACRAAIIFSLSSTSPLTSSGRASESAFSCTIIAHWRGGTNHTKSHVDLRFLNPFSAPFSPPCKKRISRWRPYAPGPAPIRSPPLAS